MGRFCREWKRIFIGNEGSQRTVALENEEEGEIMKKKRRNRFWENVQLLLR